MTSAQQTRALAHLPGLDIEIVHRLPAAEGGESIGVMLRATPSFDALLASLAEAHPELEVEVHAGGQPNYALLVGAE